MAQVFTHSYVQNLQSNLSIKIGQEPKSINGNQYNDYYFQLLIFENEDTPKLVYGTKEALQTKYNLDSSSFPSSGATVDKEFCPSGKDQPKDNPLAQAELSTVYFLLQTRKLSQMIAYTWLEPENIPDEMKAKVNLVRKILRFPHQKVCTYWLDNPQEAESPISEIDLSRKLLGDSETHPKKYSWLIQPDNISYDFIALALLLCGQAFYKDKVNFYYPDKHEYFAHIWEPIGSIYQLIFEYGLDVTWELFHGVMTEIVRTGKDFPASKITVPYPPRPSEFNVSQSDIETWAKANDHDGSYPFYPIKNSDDWKNHQLKHVYPPSPYIPLSCL